MPLLANIGRSQFQRQHRTVVFFVSSLTVNMNSYAFRFHYFQRKFKSFNNIKNNSIFVEKTGKALEKKIFERKKESNVVVQVVLTINMRLCRLKFANYVGRYTVHKVMENK